MTNSINGSRVMALAFALVLACASAAFGQDTTIQGPGAQNNAPVRTVASGEKMKVKGTIVDRDADTFVVRDDQGYETTVLLTDRADVKSKGGFLRRGQNYDVTNLLRGLVVEVEGRGNTAGQLE